MRENVLELNGVGSTCFVVKIEVESGKEEV